MIEEPAQKAPSDRSIDMEHLDRQTFGDPQLKTEILELFVQQSRNLCERIVEAKDDAQRNDLAHMLIGSARAVGAWRVAMDAATVQEVSGSPDLDEALVRLTLGVEQAIVAIQATQD